MSDYTNMPSTLLSTLSSSILIPKPMPTFMCNSISKLMSMGIKFDMVKFLKISKGRNGQKKRINWLILNNKFIKSDFIHCYNEQHPNILLSQYKMKNKIAETVYSCLIRSFGLNIFIDLHRITRAEIFIDSYFRILLDNKWDFIVDLINLIDMNIFLCNSQLLIKNIMTIICYELQDRRDDFIQFHRAPFYSEIIRDFLFILSIMFITASKFKINPYTIESSVYTKDYVNNIEVNNQELNILLEYESYFNIVNNYFVIHNCSEFVFDNGVRLIEGYKLNGRKWGSGATDETKRRKELLHKVWGTKVKPRPPRNSNSNFNSNSNLDSDSDSGLAPIENLDIQLKKSLIIAQSMVMPMPGELPILLNQPAEEFSDDDSNKRKSPNHNSSNKPTKKGTNSELAELLLLLGRSQVNIN